MEISRRKHYFIEEDHGLASLPEVKLGASSQNGVVSSPFCYTRRNSLSNMSHFYTQSHYYHHSPRSAVSGRFHDSRFEPHFLDACALCKKPLEKRDIYMYRGDIPFCSEECRHEEMERDEAKEKKQSLSSSFRKAMRRNEQRKSSSSSSAARSPAFAFTNSSVAAA